MGNLLKILRNNEVINLIIRKILLSINKIYSTIQPSWRISGTVDLEFKNLKFKYYSSCDDGIVDTLYYKHPHPEEGELMLINAIAKNSSCVIDVGANTGLYSIIASKSNPNLKIIAIEPHPGNVKRLKKNIQLNNITNVNIIEKAVGDTEKTIHFNIPETLAISDTSSADSKFSHQTYSGKLQWKEIPVQQISLNSLMESIDLNSVEIIKIDVEGYEMNVFEGAKRFIETFQPIIICEIFLDENKKQYFDSYFKQLGYHSYLCLKHGLLQLDSGLIYNYDGWNYVFSKGKTSNIFNSYLNLNSWIHELKK
ncbi:MAG: FkbM family methyltransferase [Cytophagales bacterium]|nr:FkbM family methyltransferase [Cytophagales bacterium]